MDESLAVAEEVIAREARGLIYPFGQYAPGPAELKEVADGVFWLRMPLPISLDHINLYVLDDGDSWTIVDTGMRSDQIKALWTQLLEGPLAGKPVGRVLVTHFHPDHLGLAGWLCEQAKAPLLMSRTEYLLASMLMFGAKPEPPQSVINFYASAGWSEDDLATVKGRGWGFFARVVHWLPYEYIRLQDGETLTIGGRTWRIVVGSGHSPEHLCLVCDELKVMLAGDQVLPRISSNVSVPVTEPESDPLRDWLESIDRLRSVDPDVLVLPAHNEPFYGLHERLDQLANDHARRLDRLEAHCATPRTVVECFEVLFRKRITVGDVMTATGEALAHLNYLKNIGRIRCERRGGVNVYTAN